jgi:putative flippase GtrA
LNRNRPWPARLLIVRFGLVSLANEGLYFILYWLFLRLTGNTITTLAIAGSICILVNAYTHARITFRVRLHWRLLLGYIQIQLIGFSLSFLAGMLAKNAGVSDLLIAFLTYTLWALCSFLLTRRLFHGPQPSTDFSHATKGKRLLASPRSEE